MLPQVRWKIATFAPEYARGNAEVNVLEWSYRNGGKKKNEEIKYSSRSLFLYSHHHT